jgi:hypothetical protein
VDSPAALPRLLLIGVSVRALAESALRAPLARRRFPGGILALDYFGDADLARHAEAAPGDRRAAVPAPGNRRAAMRAASRPAPTVLSIRRDLGRCRDPSELAAAARSLDWEACAYAGGMENRPALLEWLERHGRVIGNPAPVVRDVRDPERLFEFLGAADLPHPRTLFGRRAPAAPIGAWLWKGRRSGAGLRVRTARAGSARPRGFYAQEFVEGTPGSVAILADGREAALLGASLMLVGEPRLGGSGFMYCGSLAGRLEEILPEGARAVLERAASLLTGRFALRGLNGIDFVLRDDVPFLIEVNPRYTASMELLEERAAPSYFDLHLEACEGRLPSLPAGTAAGAPPFLAKGIVYAASRLESIDPDDLFALGCRDVSRRGETIGPGEPVCTVVAAGATPDDCRRLLFERAERVRALLL